MSRTLINKEYRKLGFSPTSEDPDPTLLDTLIVLWKQKWIIIATTMVFLFASLVYIKTAAPVYEARLTVMPPLTSQLDGLNVGRSYSKHALLNPIKVVEVYTLFIENLKSAAVSQQFFKRVFSPSLTDNQKKQTNIPRLYAKSLRILPDTFSESALLKKYFVVARASKPSEAQAWVKQYVDFANEQAHKDAITVVEHQNKELAHYNQWKIASLKATYAQEQTEVMNLAKASEVQSKRAHPSAQTIERDISNKVFFNTNTRAKVMAVEALAAKLEDRYQQRLLELKAESDWYANIDLTSAKFEVYRMDGEISSSDKPVWPNQKLIIILGLIAGFLAGITLALMRQAFKCRS